MDQEQNILQIENLSKYFGGLAAVSDCSLKIKKGSITGIIGPNGSGKTTLFNLIAGNLKSSQGKVLFNNEDVTDVPSYELFSKGILRTFQIAHEFTNLSVLENLMMVPANQSGENLMTALLKPSLVRTEELKVKQKAQDVVDFLNLTHLSNELAGNLSGGQKKLLELGRTMMVDAKLVLLDEVGAGVNRTLLKDLGTAILKLNKEEGYTFCMIEHDMEFISRLCNFCDAAKRLLARNNVEYKEINIATVDGAMDEMITKANGKRTIPQIFFDDNHIGGYDDVRALEKENKLLELLK
ncbi:ATP-binding cassette domain-containing protein [Candidatus Pelagibacter ubique]|nr:ATP-binding cassette domain-containing protein [Candidatus Pelagibacter ubique]